MGFTPLKDAQQQGGAMGAPSVVHYEQGSWLFRATKGDVELHLLGSLHTLSSQVLPDFVKKIMYSQPVLLTEFGDNSEGPMWLFDLLSRLETGAYTCSKLIKDLPDWSWVTFADLKKALEKKLEEPGSTDNKQKKEIFKQKLFALFDDPNTFLWKVIILLELVLMQADTEEGIDLDLMEIFSQAKKPVLALDTLDEKVKFVQCMFRLPSDPQALEDCLFNSIDKIVKADEDQKETKGLKNEKKQTQSSFYHDEDDLYLKAYLQGTIPAATYESREQQVATEALFDKRNQAWLEQLQVLLAEHPRMGIVVGAGHLVKEVSLLQLLAREGFSIERYDRHGVVKKVDLDDSSHKVTFALR